MMAAIGLTKLAVGRIAQADIFAETLDQPVGTIQSNPTAHTIPDKAACDGGQRRHQEQNRQRQEIGGCRHAEEQQQHMRGRQRQDLFCEGEAGDAEQAEPQDRRQWISHAKRQS
ncbi:hypothetical protein [Mesorhizobium sp. LSHC440A00]|uniref:hypothetical protein n=1 Tax=Mesorhizobium sp. LSHC440A00 TaxID=1287307 RepID=UPI0003CED57E|nr:hypothetical protein [Mesorhizobium sp. LSHC440A00]ESX42516.1 hypothetical protein X764_11725 [Mesorhizobium sp. LSHC440A00]